MIAMVFFWASFLLISLLFIMKAFEGRAGKVYFASSRAVLDREVVLAFRKVEDMHLGERFERIVKSIIRRIEHDSAVTLLFITRLIERRLSLVVSAIKGRRRLEKKESSEYIKTITEHKNGLRNGE